MYEDIRVRWCVCKCRKNVTLSGFKKHRQRGYDTDLEVELAVDGLALGVDQLEGVRAVAVHVAVAVGQATVAEQEGHLGNNSQTANEEQFACKEPLSSLA